MHYCIAVDYSSRLGYVYILACCVIHVLFLRFWCVTTARRKKRGRKSNFNLVTVVVQLYRHLMVRCVFSSLSCEGLRFCSDDGRVPKRNPPTLGFCPFCSVFPKRYAFFLFPPVIFTLLWRFMINRSPHAQDLPSITIPDLKHRTLVTSTWSMRCSTSPTEG